MVDSEGDRTSENKEVGGAEGGLKKKKSELLEIAKDEVKRKRLIEKWERNLQGSKERFKRKLVGGKREYKDKLDEIIKEAEGRLSEIEGMKEGKRLKELEKLEAESKIKIDRLIREIEEEAGKTKDKKIDSLAKKDSQTARFWQQWQEVEKIKNRFEEELGKTKPAEERLVALQDQLISSQEQLKETMVTLEDFKAPLEIREYWEKEIGEKIRRQMRKIDGWKEEINKVDRLIEELKIKELNPRRELSEHEVAQAIKEVTRLIKSGKASEEELELLGEKMNTLGRMLKQIRTKEQDRVKKRISKRREELSSQLGSLEKKASEDPEKYKKIYDEVKKDLEGLDEEEKRTIELIKQEGTEALVAELTKPYESSRAVSERADVIEGTLGKMIGVSGSREKWQRALEGWEQFQRESMAITNPDIAKIDAMKDVIKVALERYIEKGGEKAITEEDIKRWAFGKVEEVIKSGDEATGYTARQLIGQISSVFAAAELNFSPELMEDYRARLPAETRQAVTDFLEGDHVKAISNKTRDMIEAMLAVSQFNNVYSHSQHAEDVVRASAGLEMWHIGEVLEAEGVKRKIRGRVGFYAVEMDKERFKVKMADSAKIGDIEFAQPRGEGVKEVYEKVAEKPARLVTSSKKEISLDSLDRMLLVEDEINMRPAELLNLMNQERFANRLLSLDGRVKETARNELVREAIAVNMGLVDIDGNVNWDFIREKLGEDFKIMVGDEELNPETYKIRLHLAVREIDDKKVTWDLGMKEKSFTEVEQYFRWAEKLAEGIWRFSGTSVGAWDKHHLGNSEDWVRKIYHLVPYCTKFGIGTAFLREMVHTDFVDIFSRRKGELIQGKIKKAIEFYNKDGSRKNENDLSDDEKAAKDLLTRMLLDRDGFLMPRSRMIDTLNYYNKLKKKDSGEANKWLRERLLRLAEFDMGERDAKIKVNKAMKVLGRGEFGFDGLGTGFEAYLEKIKQEYKFENFDWGFTWNERIIKEYQYQLSAEKYRGQLIGWLMSPGSIKQMIEALKTPGYYGASDTRRKFMMMFEKQRQYFTRAGLLGVEYPVLDMPGYNNKDYADRQNPWDGVLEYEYERKAPGFFPAREINAEPWLPSHFEKEIEQAQIAKIIPDIRDAFRLKNEVATGTWMRNVDVLIEKSPPLIKEMLQGVRFILMGGEVPTIFFGGLIRRFWGAVYFEGIIAWILKKLKELAADIWRHKGDIARGTLGEAGKQIGEDLKRS